MSVLRNRLAKLEANRPALGAGEPLDLSGLDPDVQARILQAMAAGGFPLGFSDADLQAVIGLMNEHGDAT